MSKNGELACGIRNKCESEAVRVQEIRKCKNGMRRAAHGEKFCLVWAGYVEKEAQHDYSVYAVNTWSDFFVREHGTRRCSQWHEGLKEHILL